MLRALCGQRCDRCCSLILQRFRPLDFHETLCQFPILISGPGLSCFGNVGCFAKVCPQNAGKEMRAAIAHRDPYWSAAASGLPEYSSTQANLDFALWFGSRMQHNLEPWQVRHQQWKAIWHQRLVKHGNHELCQMESNTRQVQRKSKLCLQSDKCRRPLSRQSVGSDWNGDGLQLAQNASFYGLKPAQYVQNPAPTAVLALHTRNILELWCVA